MHALVFQLQMQHWAFVGNGSRLCCANRAVWCLFSSVTFPFIRFPFRNRFRKTVSVLPFRNAIAVMPLPFRTFGAVYHSILANGRVELSISPDGPVGCRANFPRFRVGGAPGLLATATAKIELDPIWTDERKRNAGNQAWHRQWKVVEIISKYVMSTIFSLSYA